MKNKNMYLYSIIGIILGFIIVLFSFAYWTNSLSFELTSENYYTEDLNYQKVINAKSLTFKDNVSPYVTMNQNEVEMIFVENNQTIIGNINVYSPSSSAFDLNFDFNLDMQNKLKFQVKENTPLSSIIKVKWSVNKLDYYFETPLYNLKNN